MIGVNDYIAGQEPEPEPEKPTYVPAPVAEPVKEVVIEEKPATQYEEPRRHDNPEAHAESFVKECDDLECAIDFDAPIDIILNISSEVKNALLAEIEEAAE